MCILTRSPIHHLEHRYKHGRLHRVVLGNTTRQQIRASTEVRDGVRQAIMKNLLLILFVVFALAIGASLGFASTNSLARIVEQDWFREGLKLWPVLVAGVMVLFGGLLGLYGAHYGSARNLENITDLFRNQWQAQSDHEARVRDQEARTLAMALVAELRNLQSRLSGYAIGIEAWNEADFVPTAAQLRAAINTETPIFTANAHRIGLLGPEAASSVVGFYGLVQLLQESITVDAAALGNTPIRRRTLLDYESRMEKAALDAVQVIGLLTDSNASTDAPGALKQLTTHPKLDRIS